MRMWAFVLMGSVGLAAGVFSSSSGCGADAAFDCHQVCDRYKTCFDQSYDVGACSERCRTNSANSSTVRSQADQCEACIDDKSCASATFSCATTCGSIVP